MKQKRIKTAYFVVKAEYFKDIADGKKTSEFRNASPYWIDRLDNSVDEAVFQLGYGSNGRPPPRMRFKVGGIFIHDPFHGTIIPYPRSVDELPKGFRACLIEVNLSERLE